MRARSRLRGRRVTTSSVLQIEPGTGGVFDPDLGHVRLIDGLKPLDDEPVLRRTSHHAFTTTNLRHYFTAHGVTEVIVTGIRTKQCCETTARLASDLGHQVQFVPGATPRCRSSAETAPAR